MDTQRRFWGFLLFFSHIPKLNDRFTALEDALRPSARPMDALVGAILRPDFSMKFSPSKTWKVD
jgi:hypothetical protein